MEMIYSLYNLFMLKLGICFLKKLLSDNLTQLLEIAIEIVDLPN